MARSFAFTGPSRDLKPDELAIIDRTLDRLKADEFITGAAAGVDLYVAEQVKARGMGHNRVIAPGAGHSRKARKVADSYEKMPALRDDLTSYMARNQRMVDEADALVAFLPTEKVTRRGGPSATIRRARQAGIPIYIVPLNGATPVAESAATRNTRAVSRQGGPRALREYGPDQPRIPAGKPGGGRWGGLTSSALDATSAQDRLEAIEPEVIDAAFTIEHNGLASTISNVEMGGDGIQIEGEIYPDDYDPERDYDPDDPEGDLVGTWRRYISLESGHLAVYHAGLDLKDRHQGAGFAAAFNAQAEAAYREWGVEAVTISAVDVGAFAWARAGWSFAPGSTFARPDTASGATGAWRLGDAIKRPSYRQRFTTGNKEREDLRETYGDEAVEEFFARFPTSKEADDADHDSSAVEGKFTSEFSIAAWGEENAFEGEDGRRHWLGKDAILGRSWAGIKMLNQAPVQEADAGSIQRIHDEWLASKTDGVVFEGDATHWEDDEDFWALARAADLREGSGSVTEGVVRVGSYTRRGIRGGLVRVRRHQRAQDLMNQLLSPKGAPGANALGPNRLPLPLTAPVSKSKEYDKRVKAVAKDLDELYADDVTPAKAKRILKRYEAMEGLELPTTLGTVDDMVDMAEVADEYGMPALAKRLDRHIRVARERSGVAKPTLGPSDPGAKYVVTPIGGGPAIGYFKTKKDAQVAADLGAGTVKAHTPKPDPTVKAGDTVTIDNGGTYQGRKVEVVRLDPDGAVIVKHPKPTAKTKLMRLQPARDGGDAGALGGQFKVGSKDAEGAEVGGVRPGDRVTDLWGGEWIVHGTSRYAGGKGNRVRGMSVRPADGGRARVMPNTSFRLGGSGMPDAIPATKRKANQKRYEAEQRRQAEEKKKKAAAKRAEAKKSTPPKPKKKVKVVPRPPSDLDDAKRPKGQDADNPDPREFAGLARGGKVIDVASAPIADVRGALVRYEVGGVKGRWEWGVALDRSKSKGHLRIVPLSYRGRTVEWVPTDAVQQAKRIDQDSEKMKKLWRKAQAKVPTDRREEVKRARAGKPTGATEPKMGRKAQGPPKPRAPKVGQSDRPVESLEHANPGDLVEWSSENVPERTRTGIVVSHPEPGVLHVYERVSSRGAGGASAPDKGRGTTGGAQGENVWVNHARVTSHVGLTHDPDRPLHEHRTALATQLGQAFVDARRQAEVRGGDRDREMRDAAGAAFRAAKDAAPPPKPVTGGTVKTRDAGARIDRGKVSSNFHPLATPSHQRLGDEVMFILDGKSYKGFVTFNEARRKRLKVWVNSIKKEVEIADGDVHHSIQLSRADRVLNFRKGKGTAPIKGMNPGRREELIKLTMADKGKHKRLVDDEGYSTFFRNRLFDREKHGLVGAPFPSAPGDQYTTDDNYADRKRAGGEDAVYSEWIYRQGGPKGYVETTNDAGEFGEALASKALDLVDQLIEGRRVHTFNPADHPRDALGRFTRVLEDLHGQHVAQVGTIRVRKLGGNFAVFEPARDTKAFRSAKDAARYAFDRTSQRSMLRRQLRPVTEAGFGIADVGNYLRRQDGKVIRVQRHNRGFDPAEALKAALKGSQSSPTGRTGGARAAAGAAPKGSQSSPTGRTGGARAGAATRSHTSQQEPRAKGRGRGGSSAKATVVDVGDDVNRAADLLAQGTKVRLASKRQASTLLSELAKRVQEAKELGDQAPNFDLCKVTVRNTNLFCAQSKGIPRIKMPQLGGKPLPGSKADKMEKDEKGEVDLTAGLRAMLEGKGVKVTDETQKAAFLKASQIELNGAKVASMTAVLDSGGELGGDPLLVVSHDDYIVDGHHRWAANVGHDLADGVGGEVEMDVARVDMGIIELLAAANKYAADMGIPQAAVGQNSSVTPANDPTPITDGPKTNTPDRDAVSARRTAQQAVDRDWESLRRQSGGVPLAAAKSKSTKVKPRTKKPPTPRVVGRADLERAQFELGYLNGEPSADAKPLLKEWKAQSDEFLRDAFGSGYPVSQNGEGDLLGQVANIAEQEGDNDFAERLDDLRSTPDERMGRAGEILGDLLRADAPGIDVSAERLADLNRLSDSQLAWLRDKKVSIELTLKEPGKVNRTNPVLKAARFQNANWAGLYSSGNGPHREGMGDRGGQIIIAGPRNHWDDDPPDIWGLGPPVLHEVGHALNDYGVIEHTAIREHHLNLWDVADERDVMGFQYNFDTGGFDSNSVGSVEEPVLHSHLRQDGPGGWTGTKELAADSFAWIMKYGWWKAAERFGDEGELANYLEERIDAHFNDAEIAEQNAEQPAPGLPVDPEGLPKEGDSWSLHIDGIFYDGVGPIEIEDGEAELGEINVSGYVRRVAGKTVRVSRHTRDIDPRKLLSTARRGGPRAAVKAASEPKAKVRIAAPEPDVPGRDGPKTTDDARKTKTPPLRGSTERDLVYPKAPTQPVIGPRTQEQMFADLQAEAGRLGQDLGRFLGDHKDPDARDLIDEQIRVQKAIHHLELDRGGPQGVGKPGGPRDLVVVGSGPSGLSAALYGGSEGLDTLLIEAEDRVGGQMSMSSRIENLVGFPVGVKGKDLAGDAELQVMRMGAEVKTETRVVSMTYNEETGMKDLTLSTGEVIEARAVVLGAGVQSRPFTKPGADAKGVTYGDVEMLTKDCSRPGAPRRPGIIVGGANSAGQAAMEASKVLPHVTLVIRSPEGPTTGINKEMVDYLIAQVRGVENITVLEGTEVEEIYKDGAGFVDGVRLSNGMELDAGGVAVMIGSVPKVDWAGIKTTERGYAVIGEGENGLETSMPGVYATGDVRDGVPRRVAAAIGSGAEAVSSVHLFALSVGSPERRDAAIARRKGQQALDHDWEMLRRLSGGLMEGAGDVRLGKDGLADPDQWPDDEVDKWRNRAAVYDWHHPPLDKDDDGVLGEDSGYMGAVE